MGTFQISFNGNQAETWAHRNLVDAFDSYEISQIDALSEGQRLYFNDGTIVRRAEG